MGAEIRLSSLAFFLFAEQNFCLIAGQLKRSRAVEEGRSQAEGWLWNPRQRQRLHSERQKSGRWTYCSSFRQLRRCAVLINRAIKGNILWKANMRVAAGFKGGQNNGARKKLANKCTWYYSFDLRLFRRVQKRTHPSSNTALYIINGALPFVRFAIYKILLLAALFGARFI